MIGPESPAAHNGGSFARLPPAPTTLCYLRLSVATAVGLLSVASVAGRPSPGRAALNELSAPALTIHDVTSSHACAVVLAEARADHNAVDGPVLCADCWARRRCQPLRAELARRMVTLRIACCGGSWTGVPDNPSVVSAISAMIRAIRAASVHRERGRTSCKRQVSGSNPLTGSSSEG